jgi:hypothetical protein
VLVAVGLLSVANVIGQSTRQSASDLVRYLTYQSDQAPPMRFNGCSDPREEREAAHSLVALGVSAIPDIESALSFLQPAGHQMEGSVDSKWLLFAYAQIKGPAGYTLLQSLIDNSNLSHLRRRLDNAVAISFGLTSYVSGIRTPEAYLNCGIKEPRSTLDDMILAWERNDLPWLEKQLGPNAQAAMDALLAERSWVGLRAHLWRGRSDSNVAMGYRFDIRNEWSEPEEVLDQRVTDARRHVNLGQYPMAPNLQTQFRNRAGFGCGQRGVKFLRIVEELHTKYVVDESDMEGLLNVISACAAT